MQRHFADLTEHTQVAMRRLADSLEGMKPSETKTWTVRTSELRADAGPPSIVADVQQWEAGGRPSAFLYSFTATDNLDLSMVERAFADAKARERNERAYARLISVSRCFYIGGSRSLAQRLKEHLGFGTRKTYAMQLAHWAMPLRINLEFACARYPAPIDEAVLQALEDTLWSQMQPMFGRKGQR